jgi:hypothetical protein
MLGRKPLLLGLVALLATGGCSDDGLPPASPELAPAAIGAAFDPADTGTIEGRVVWDGPVPDVPPIVAISSPDGNLPPDGKLLCREPNPFAPRIDSESHGVEGAIVFLREVDPRRARTWHHGSVRVEASQREFRVLQDGAASRAGFVRRGDVIEAVNRDPKYHSLRARGAAFFNLPLVDADKVITRKLDKLGVVVISSGAGYPWMHAHLFVVDHPYYTRTDKQGRFRFEQVPKGTDAVVCWMPSWVIERSERDPESFQLARLTFAAPVEQTKFLFDKRRGESAWDRNSIWFHLMQENFAVKPQANGNRAIAP